MNLPPLNNDSVQCIYGQESCLHSLSVDGWCLCSWRQRSGSCIYTGLAGETSRSVCLSFTTLYLSFSSLYLSLHDTVSEYWKLIPDLSGDNTFADVCTCGVKIDKQLFVFFLIVSLLPVYKGKSLNTFVLLSDSRTVDTRSSQQAFSILKWVI